MHLIEWNEKLLLGVEAIDAEHRRLVDLLNELYAAHEEKSAPAVLGHIIDQLIAYTAYHFLHEEKLFLGTGYPDADLHVEEHRALTKRVLDIQRKVHFGATDRLSDEVAAFLKEWFIHHTQGLDRGYVPYISKEKQAQEQLT